MPEHQIAFNLTGTGRLGRARHNSSSPKGNLPCSWSIVLFVEHATLTLRFVHRFRAGSRSVLRLSQRMTSPAVYTNDNKLMIHSRATAGLSCRWELTAQLIDWSPAISSFFYFRPGRVVVSEHTMEGPSRQIILSLLRQMP